MGSRSGDEQLSDGSQSPLKKTKLEAEGQGGAEAVAADDEAEEQRPHICNNWENCVMQCDDPKKDRQMRLYTRQYHESGGFDVTDFPTFGFIGKLIPVDLNDSYSTGICTKALELAIEHHNKKKNTDLELVKIVKSNMHPFSSFLQPLRLKVSLKTKMPKPIRLACFTISSTAALSLTFSERKVASLSLPIE
ncbi:uncharacterized protein LOC126661844 [Mercurialis annua]|uniref:uncharacterized protein LOC126661844 n=1 Tax=Mercurialis annua TaxID=3986 RepID=UPI002160AB66|nr:uncharacterized protein LOC126661844 [Mercurialis annua]